jgi:formylglycine-generating enzyme required for sulfatase activity
VLHLGAFGKHPGWNDHIDDQGLSTPAMVAFKQTMYVQGITDAIPRWEGLEEGQRLEGFGHLLVHRTPPVGPGQPAGVMMARLWSSADGKGRSKYPMIALLQGAGVGLEWLVRVAAPELAGLEEACRGTGSAGEVVARVDGAREALRSAAASALSLEEPEDPGLLAGLASRPELGPDRVGLLRVLYQLQREVGPRLSDGPMGPGSEASDRRVAAQPAHHLRVPSLGATEDSLLAWSRLLMMMLGDGDPITLIAPLGGRFVDIVIGRLGPGDVFCLRAGEPIMPLTTSVPYSIEPEFERATQAWLQRRGVPPVSGTAAAAMPGRGTTLLLALAAGGVLLSGSRLAAQTPDPAGVQAGAPVVADDAARRAIADAPAPVEGSAALQLAWRQAKRNLLAIHDAGEPERAAQVAARVRELLTNIDAQVPRGIDRTDLPSSAWLDALDEAALTRRERILRQMVDSWRGNTPSPEDAGVARQIGVAKTAHGQWLERAGIMASQLVRLERDLSLGAPLEQPTPAGTLREIAARWESDVLMTDPIVREAVRPPLERAAKVQTVLNSTDAPALAAMVVDAGTGIDLRLAAWRRLGGLRFGPAAWPSTPEQLRTEASFTEPLKLVIQSVPDPARRDALLSELAIQQRARFDRTISASTDVSAVAAAVELGPELGVTSDTASPRVKFNLGLVELKRLVNDPATTDAQARSAAEEFIARAKALPGGVAFLSDAQAVLNPLAGILAGRVVQPVAPMPTNLGPAGTGLWTSRIEAGVARFRPSHRGLPELVFVMVPADGASRDVTFVSTTEVSVGMFASVFAELSSRRQLQQVLPVFDPLSDPRRGVRTWDWAGTVDGVPAIVPSADWHGPEALVSTDIYAPGLALLPPGRDHPMTQVSPGAALLAARLINCRLPTPGEWERAVEKADADGPTPNVRDQTFARQREFLEQARAAGARTVDLGAGVFRAGPEGADVGSTASVDDGTLWFRPVREGGAAGEGEPARMRDLIGNAAEWVMFAGKGELPEARPRAVLDFVARNAAQVRVIGGSALSDPGIEPGRALEVNIQDASEGYADVGFRLAFSVPGAVAGTGMGLAAQIDRLLTPTPMLPAR